ncbi:hypothetical protein BJV82DRAFT_639143 [Fennellomyces sp. T-0311]|nr:hypothetical protein BJV82DRAFT_639143 [Fennellomyces sp. T-0311]
MSTADVELLKEKAVEIDNAKNSIVDDHLERAEVGATLRRNIRTIISKMAAQLDWDVTVLMMSPRGNEYGMTLPLCTSSKYLDESIYDVLKYYIIERLYEVVSELKVHEYFGYICGMKKPFQYSRSQTKDRGEVQKKLFADYSTKTKGKVTNINWSSFKRIMIDGEYRYRNKKYCVDLIGHDFKTATAPNLSADCNTWKVLSKKFDKKTLRFESFDCNGAAGNSSDQINVDDQ